MQTITIPVTVTGSNGKKILVPNAKVALINGEVDIVMSDLLISMVENMCAQQDEGYSEGKWTPDRISLFDKDPSGYRPYHGVTLDRWAPATPEAKAKVKQLLEGVLVE